MVVTVLPPHFPFSEPGLIDAVLQSLNACDSNVRSLLLNNIVLTGNKEFLTSLCIRIHPVHMKVE